MAASDGPSMLGYEKQGYVSPIDFEKEALLVTLVLNRQQARQVLINCLTLTHIHPVSTLQSELQL